MLLLLVPLFLFHPTNSADSLPSTHSTLGRNFAVASYLPEWRYEGANWDEISKHSTHVILFSLEPTAGGDITALDRIPRPELLQQARAAATRYGAKLMICFGGNGRSAGFSAMVRDDQARERFVEKAVQLVEQQDFDGIDYNWEYPGCGCVLCVFVGFISLCPCLVNVIFSA